MTNAVRRAVLIGGLVVAGIGGLAPDAWGSIAPALSLDQSSGTTAGSSANLGLDLQFSPSVGDSPDQMTLDLPPGLLANASIDGGACLTTADLTDSACEVGSGTVTAKAYGTVPIAAPVTFDLVPPPKPGDLAGLAVNSSGTQVGSTADVMVRPSSDPEGVGIRIAFVLPNTLDGVPISISEIRSTFDGLRYPTACPSPPQNFIVEANSYADSTIHTMTAPLSVTGCSSLAYSPAFKATAVRDSADRQAGVTTEITQAPTEAPSKAVTLAFPFPTLGSNLGALGVICPTLSSGNCTSVGSVTAISPLYPKALSGSAYLTGSLGALSLSLVFPSPFPLTLTGAVDLSHNSAAFTGLPDIPLTTLQVSLQGGAQGLFIATCAPASGTATAMLTDQNGDRTVTLPSSFTVLGCPSIGAAGSRQLAAGSMQLTGGRWSGLGAGRPFLSFRLAATNGAPKVTALAIRLPGGLSFVRHRVGKRLKLAGVTLAGAQIKSLAPSQGRLLIRLRKPVTGLTVKLGPAALHETAALKAKARKLHRLALGLLVDTANGRQTSIHELLRIIKR